MAALFVSATNVEEGIYLFFILLGMGQLLFSKQFKKVPFSPLFFLAIWAREMDDPGVKVPAA